MWELPDTIESEKALDELLARPYPELIELMGRLEGDLLILGAGGKMGPSLAHLALNACREAGADKRVIAVSRFSDQAQCERLDRLGVETIACDLLKVEAVEALPRARNVVFMAGRKFGAAGSEWLTWMMNVAVPAHVARVFKGSRIVVFSTGCVYPPVAPASGGCAETDAAAPVGEYAHSCLGRERVIEYHSREFGTPALLFRLNYAIDMRYGVLLDIARSVHAGRPVDRGAPALNCIWQGDANNRALLCLERAASPPAVLNVTGGETLSVATLACEFATRFGLEATFTGADSGVAYLSNAQQSLALFGPPKVKTQKMIDWTAGWVRRGGRTLDKPTLFHVTDGDFLQS